LLLERQAADNPAIDGSNGWFEGGGRVLELEADYLSVVQRRAGRLARAGWLAEGYTVLLAGLERARDLLGRGLFPPPLVLAWEGALRTYCELHWMKEPAGFSGAELPVHVRAQLRETIDHADRAAQLGQVLRGYQALLTQLELAEVLRHEDWGSEFRSQCHGALRSYTVRYTLPGGEQPAG
jgi:hypothetical protein